MILQLTVQELEHIKALVRQEVVLFCSEHEYRKNNPESKDTVPPEIRAAIEKEYDEWKA